MKHKDLTGIIPAQYTGQEIETDATIELDNEYQAKTFYKLAKNRLLLVNDWNEVAGLITAKFQLIDEQGEEANREVQKGDHFRIDIPGPGNKKGDGYDWVLVVEIKEASGENWESIGIRVRPSDNPLSDKDGIAHFYSEEASSNFILFREDNKVTAWIVDRNIKPNTDAESITEKIRDTAVGLSAVGLFSKVQWQGLADGLVKDKD